MKSWWWPRRLGMLAMAVIIMTSWANGVASAHAPSLSFGDMAEAIMGAPYAPTVAHAIVHRGLEIGTLMLLLFVTSI
jgi:hypothetical protein